MHRAEPATARARRAEHFPAHREQVRADQSPLTKRPRTSSGWPSPKRTRTNSGKPTRCTDPPCATAAPAVRSSSSRFHRRREPRLLPRTILFLPETTGDADQRKRSEARSTSVACRTAMYLDNGSSIYSSKKRSLRSAGGSARCSAIPPCATAQQKARWRDSSARCA